MWGRPLGRPFPLSTLPPETEPKGTGTDRDHNPIDLRVSAPLRETGSWIDFLILPSSFSICLSPLPTISPATHFYF
jgi:hypothetical protein